MSKQDESAAIVNPHNPEFITKRPWYLGEKETEASLQHQERTTETRQELTLSAAETLLQQQRKQESQKTSEFSKDQWVEALKKNKLPYRICQIVKVHNSNLFDLKFEDGSVEKRVKVTGGRKPRIRVTGAGNRATSTGLYQATYDSKRDEYHGYDHESHNAKVREKFEQKDSIRRKLREQRAAEKQQKGEASDSDFDDSDLESDNDDEFVQKDSDAKVMTTRLARQGGVGGAQMKVTARNLRIREDTAKYLRNLDLESAYYDPKSRSMRDDPHPESADTDFAGDNFARTSGEAIDFSQNQMFAWEASKKGVPEVHPQANPSQAELLKKQYQSQAKDLQSKRQRAVLDKYGGEEYLDTNEKDDSRELRFGVTTQAKEYKQGATLKPEKCFALTSKYEENIFINGHTTVWGSFFHKGAFQWGYADDHSLMKLSYCTGENGRIANNEANERQYGTGRAGSAALAQARTLLKPKTTSGQASQPIIANPSRLYGEADQNSKLDAAGVKEALEKEQDDGSKKRKYSSTHEVEMTEEMMEAYRLKKEQRSDPMARIGSGELLDYK